MTFNKLLQHTLACIILMSGQNFAESPDTITFIPHWVPQAQFAGYYVAYEKNIYQDSDLNVKILTGGPGNIPVEYLRENKADIASMWLADGIDKRDQGVKLILLAQIEQKSALMLIAKKSSGINKPEDMNNKKIGLWDGQFQLQPKAFFKKYGLNIIPVSQSYSVNLFLRNGVDVASAMWYNEYHTIINSGIDANELTTFFFFDHDLNFPEAGLYTMEKKFLEDSSSFNAFVKASLEGWNYAFSHEEETLDVVLSYMKKAHIPANRVHQRWMLRRMKDMIADSEGCVKQSGLKRKSYMRVGNALKSNKMIEKIPPFETFYRGVGVK